MDVWQSQGDPVVLGTRSRFRFSWMGGIIPWAGDHGWHGEESELGTGMHALLCSCLMVMV